MPSCMPHPTATELRVLSSRAAWRPAARSSSVSFQAVEPFNGCTLNWYSNTNAPP